MPEEVSETTRLLEPQKPQYIYGSSLARKRRVKQFQCCLCSILMISLLAALVLTVAYTVHYQLNDENSTEPQRNLSGITTSDAFLILFNKMWPSEDQAEDKIFYNSSLLKEAMTEGSKLLQKKDDIENNIPSLPIDSPSYRHQKVMYTNENARNMSREGYRMEGATQFLYKFNKTKYGFPIQVCLTNYTDPFLMEMCSNVSNRCSVFNKYRSYNGTCNNLIHPSIYGVAYRPFRRAIKPDYSDGISKPRMSKRGQPLPTARTVSLEVHRPNYRSDSKFSVMLAVWGQFLDHDITATALSQKRNGTSISCCQNDDILSPECFPVFIDKTDPFSEYNVKCLEFVRSAPSPKCCLGPREQMNQATAYIDGSVIYGNDETKALSLRTMTGGLLKMFVTEDNRTLLPVSDDLNDGCNRAEEISKGRYCFSAGDSRANENLHLTSMHLIWARHHNVLAKALSSLNSHWDDEMIFQESRRIVAAQMQHITYKEFLPILLGNKLMKKLNLYPESKGYFHKYNESVDPSIANEFAAAAFRFAHSIIPGLVKFISHDTSSPEFVHMHRMLFNPFQLYRKEQLDGSLKGAMNTSIEASDSYFSNEIKSHLFEARTEQIGLPKMCGLDLVSLNIQRGRDHGLAGYVFWMEHCGMNRSKNFDDLSNIMEPTSLNNIRAIYKDVSDIDLYTGALSELPLEGSILGPTLTCLILDQFIRLKYGDRFWYENSGKPHSFTLEQLDQIRKTTLAKIICDNSDNLQTVQQRVMEGLSDKNEIVKCSEILSPDWSHWKEHLEYIPIRKEDLKVEIIN